MTLPAQRRSWRSSAGWFAATAFLVVMAGCQFLVPASTPSFTCNENQEGVCPNGNYCRNDACLACEASESCDADGYDNDCDGIVDNGNCAVGSKCDPQLRRCVTRDERADGLECESPFECKSDVCVETDRIGLGKMPGKSVCTRSCCGSGDCADGQVCVATGGGVSETMSAQGGGANFCVPADWAGPTPRSLGTRRGGEPCTAPEDCRSGLCENAFEAPANDTDAGASTDASALDASAPRPDASAPRPDAGANGAAARCRDVCCSTERGDCAAGTSCGVGSLRDAGAFVCNAGVTLKRGGDPCENNDECRSGICSGIRPVLLCIEPCCSSEECPFVGLVNVQTTCSNYPVTSAPYDAGSYFGSPLCADTQRTGGTKNFGEPCARNDECKSVHCVAPLEAASDRRCSDACCTDADCTKRDGGVGWTCRLTTPEGGDPRYPLLRCVPPAPL